MPRRVCLPMYTATPVPKMVSASPETIWLTRSVIELKAWIRDMPAPARRAASTPSHRLPDTNVALNTKVEDARSLGEDLANGSEHERRPEADAGHECEHEHGFVHAACASGSVFASPAIGSGR